MRALKIMAALMVLAAGCGPSYMGNFDSQGRYYSGPDKAGGALIFGRAMIRFDDWRIPNTMRSLRGVVTEGLSVTIGAFRNKELARTYGAQVNADGYFQIVNVDPTAQYKVTSVSFEKLGYTEKLDLPIGRPPAGRLLNLGQHVLTVDPNGSVNVVILRGDSYLSTDESLIAALKRNASSGWQKIIRDRLTDIEPDKAGGALVFGVAELLVVDQEGKATVRRSNLTVVVGEYAPHFLFGRTVVRTDENGYFQVANAPAAHRYSVEEISAEDIMLTARLPSRSPLAPLGRVVNLGTSTITAEPGKGLMCQTGGEDLYAPTEAPIKCTLARHTQGGWRELLTRRIEAASKQPAASRGAPMRIPIAPPNSGTEEQ